MLNLNNQPEKAADMRRKAAEASLAQKALSPLNTASFSAGEIQNVFHELQVHHVELEMQNEELRRAQVELDAERERYFNLFELAPVGYCTLSASGLIEKLNLAAASLLGMSRSDLIKRPLSRFIVKEDQPVYYQHRKQLLETAKEQICELRMVKADGTLWWGHLVGVAAQDEGGSPACLLTMTNITGRKQAEEERRKLLDSVQLEKERLSLIVNSIPEEVWFADNNGNLTLTNPSALRQFGISSPDGISVEALVRSLEVYRPDGTLRPVEESPPLRALRGETVRNLEEKIRIPTSGEFRDRRVNAAPVKDAGGNIIGSVSIVHDITERKKAEESLRESEAVFSQFLAHSPVLVYIKDEKLRLLKVSEGFAELLGKPTRDLLGKDSYDLLPPEFAKNAIDDDLEVLNGGKVVISEEILNDRVYTTIKFPIHREGGKPVYLGGFSVDISERKQGEQLLKESENEFRSLAESMPQIVWVTRPDGWNIYFNKQWVDYTGLTLEESYGHGWNKPFHPEDQQRAWDAWQRATQHNEKYSLECRLRRYDGAYRWWLVRGVPLLGPGGDILKWFGTCTDIDDIKLAEQTVHKSAERSQTILRVALDGFWLVDLQGKLLEVNQSYASMSGYSEQELLNLHIPDVEAEESAVDVTARIQKVISHGYDRFESRHRRKTGELFDVEVSIQYLNTDGGLLVCFIKDITERKMAEEEHQKISRIESMGTLAGGIAHDFNNLLTGILGNIQLAEMYLKQDNATPAKDVLVEAEQASLRARSLTRQLLAFSRGGERIRKVMPIASLLLETVTFALRGSKLKAEFNLADNLWPVEVDEGQISQVISNLVINSDQSMPNGGIIHVKASNVVIKARATLSPGKYVEISITDHGIGITKGNKARIFDPYFTTKQKGSGLGLATSYSIIRDHGGSIKFESELGKGSTFHIYLLAAREKLEKEDKPTAGIQPLPLGQGRILVMDDEEPILLLLDRMLKSAGYEVELAREGTETIQKFKDARDSGKPFDALILDMTVPGGMGGKETIARLLEIDPGVKAIVSSGYIADSVLADYKQSGFSAVVAKPYDIKQMQETLHKILAE